MAFMTPPAVSGRDENRLPVLGFNAKAGRLFLHDRIQQPNGEWHTVKTDVTMAQPAFALDFGRLETGWIFFSPAGPQWSMSFFGEPMRAQPDSPGVTMTGKALRFKAGFRLPVIGQSIGGVRELAGNSGALISGMNEIHTQYEESAEARAGRLPLVRMVNVLEVRTGQSNSFQPVFTILRWVERPEQLGPRMVPPPGGFNGVALRSPVLERAAPPAADRWDSEWRAEITPPASWDDSEIPF